MEFDFKYYSPKYFDSLVKLLDKCFSIENKNKDGLVKWKYFDEFFNNKSIGAIAVNNDNVIGFYSNIPIPTSLRNQRFNSLLCTDMSTDPDFRGKGIISNLSKMVYEKVGEENYDFSIGFSNDEGVKVDKNASGYGYIVLGKLVRYFKLSLRKKKTDYILSPTDKFENSYADNDSNYIKILKDLDYLNWRYLKKPNSECEIYELKRKGESVGYVVLRFLKNKCYVYDIISEKDERLIYCQILNAIENEVRSKNIKVVIYNVLDNIYWQGVFGRFKYFKKSNNKVNYYLTIKFHKDLENLDYLKNKNNWLLMNGDIL